MEIKIKWVVILLISMVFLTFWFCAHFEMWSTEDLDPEETSEPFKVSNPHTFDSLQKDIIFDLEDKPNEMFSTTTEFGNGNWYNVKSSEDRNKAELEEATTRWWDNLQFLEESTTTDMTTDEYFDWDMTTTTNSGQYVDWDMTTTTNSGQYVDWDMTTTTNSGQYVDWDMTTGSTSDQYFDRESNSVSQELGQNSLFWQDIAIQAKNSWLSRELGSTQSTTESTTEATTASVWRQKDYTDATHSFDASTTTEASTPDEDYEQTAEYSVGPEDELKLIPPTLVDDDNTVSTAIVDDDEPSYFTTSEDELASLASVGDNNSEATDPVAGNEPSYIFTSEEHFAPVVLEDGDTAAEAQADNNGTTISEDELSSMTSVYDDDSEATALAVDNQPSYLTTLEDERVSTTVEDDTGAPRATMDNTETSDSNTSADHDSVASNVVNSNEQSDSVFSLDDISSILLTSVEHSEPTPSEDNGPSYLILEETEDNDQAPLYSAVPENELSSATSADSDDYSSTDIKASEKSIDNEGGVVQTSEISEVENLAPSGFLSSEQSLINMYEKIGPPSEDVPQSQGRENIETSEANTETSSDADTKTILSTMKMYASQIQQRCQDLKHLGLLNDSDSDTNATGGVYLMVSDTYGFMGCKAAKVGGTNLQRLVYGLENDILDVASLQRSLARKQTRPMMLMNMTNQTERLDSYVKFMIYRDPLERLVSAFRDRKPGSYFSITDPTFEEYVAEASASDPVVQHSHRPWREIHNLCNPCDIPYDYILPLSMYTEGISAILSSLGVPSLKFPTREETDYKPKSSQEVATQFYSNIPNTVKEKLKQKYALDYYLFYGQMYFQA